MKKLEVSLSLYFKIGYYEIENFKVLCRQCDIEIAEGTVIKSLNGYFCSNECMRDFTLINGINK